MRWLGSPALCFSLALGLTCFLASTASAQDASSHAALEAQSRLVIFESFMSPT
jgi:hypothetical protein